MRETKYYHYCDKCGKEVEPGDIKIVDYRLNNVTGDKITKEVCRDCFKEIKKALTFKARPKTHGGAID